MKYIFTVHSPITFLSAHAVVEHLRLSLDDVILLTLDYKVPLPKYKVHPTFTMAHKGWGAKLRNLNLPAFADRYLNQILGGDSFHAFIDLMSYNQRILVTHSKCEAFHFIEEGNSSYRCGDTLDDLTWDKRQMNYRIREGLLSTVVHLIQCAKWALRGYNQRLISIPYSFSAYHDFPGTRFYGFSKLAYPQIGADKKVVLPLRSSKDIHHLAGQISLRNAIIWIDGSNSRFTGLPEEEYHYAIEDAIDTLKTELEKRSVYIKLRPGLRDYASNFLFKSLERAGVEVHVLPDDLIIECVFINSENCLVVGNLSSALFYASVFGHQSYSIFSRYRTRVSTIFDQMPGYWEKVQKI